MTDSFEVYIDEMLKKIRTKNFKTDSFDFKDEKPSLGAVISKNKVSAGAGIYIIYGEKDGQKSLLYIGKSGTIHNDGKLGIQGINKRLKKIQNGIPRDRFFREVINGAHSCHCPLDKLRIEWFETYKNGVGTPPFLVEAQLLAQYLAENGSLPPLNKEA